MDNKTILVVDDEPSLLLSLQIKLSAEGFTVLTAREGEEGLRMALERHPDLILLDILMPVMDGISMLRALRKDTWGKRVDVIILSNLSEQEKERTDELAGVRDYIIKSNWNLDDIVSKIREYTG